MTDVTLEPLDDHIVLEPVDESELPSGLIVPANEAARSAAAASSRPSARTSARFEPGDKVLFPRDAGFEVRLARSSHRVRVLRARGRYRPHSRLGSPGTLSRDRRGGRAVECGGLENRYPSLGG